MDTFSARLRPYLFKAVYEMTDRESTGEVNRQASSSNVLESVIDRLALRPALMLLKIRLQLLLGAGGIEQEFLTRAKSEAADVTIGQARCLADEPCDLQVTLRH